MNDLGMRAFIVSVRSLSEATVVRVHIEPIGIWAPVGSPEYAALGGPTPRAMDHSPEPSSATAPTSVGGGPSPEAPETAPRAGSDQSSGSAAVKGDGLPRSRPAKKSAQDVLDAAAKAGRSS